MELAALGFQIIRSMDLRREALPYMTQLVHECDETCDLSMFDRGEVFCIEVVRSRRFFLLATAIGQRLPAHATASGKLFLACLPPDQREAFLSRPLRAYTPKTVTSPDELRGQLEAIHEQDYGYDDEEYEPGVRAVSAPIRDGSGNVVAVLSLPVPVGRMTPDRLPEIVTLLKKAAQAISMRMGWRP